MMNKIYDAKITTKEKPFIHGMYQNYHQKFCDKFKNKYIEEFAVLSKSFNNISAIKSKSGSQISDYTNILGEIQSGSP
jgi:hypothetical protein